jgi:tripartite-type tricarboxylate transporter receptor subunit TctC
MKALSRTIPALALACSLVAAAGAARAADDDYPNHPVRWLVGYPPGGSTDICARLIGQYLSEHLHQQFAVENKPGAGNNLATEIAVHAPADGYTVFLVNPANAINASLYKNLPFDFIRDMTPVAGFMRVPNVMEVNRTCRRTRSTSSSTTRRPIRARSISPRRGSALRCICRARCS